MAAGACPERAQRVEWGRVEAAFGGWRMMGRLEACPPKASGLPMATGTVAPL